MSTTETPQVTTAHPLWRVLRDYANQRFSALQGAYLRSTPAAKAALAQLRRCDPSSDENMIDAWEQVFSDPPTELIAAGDAPSRAERSLIATAHLFAVHQQSKQEPMHVAGIGLGTAVRRLSNPTDEKSQESAVMRRFHALSTATEFAEIIHHLRGLVGLLRSSGIPLDYPRLTTDLYFLTDQATRSRVRLAWARDLTRRPGTAKISREDAPSEEQTSAAA